MTDASHGLPEEIVGRAGEFLALIAPDDCGPRCLESLLSLLASVRVAAVEEVARSVESLARQAGREEVRAALAAEGRPYRSAALAAAEASSPDTANPVPGAERAEQAVARRLAEHGGDLGAMLDANARQRHALIDSAIFAVLPGKTVVAEALQPGALSSEVARALERRGARIHHVEVADGLLRLVRARKATTRSGFYWRTDVAEEPSA